MELAQYYGGAPSGGAFSGGMFRHNMMNPMYGGVGKMTGRTNRSSAFMECKKKAYASAMEGWKQGVNPIKPVWNRFGAEASGCQKGVYQTPLERKKKGRTLTLTKAGVARKRRKDFEVSRAFPSYIPCNIRGTVMSLSQLRQQAKSLGIKGYSKARKADLCQALGNMGIGLA